MNLCRSTRFDWLPWTLLVALFLDISRADLSAANPDPPSSPPASGQPLKTVFGITRPADHDILWLGNGEILSGTLLTETITVRTRWGALALPTRLLAGIEFDTHPAHLESVVTINRNSFSGFVEETRFTLERPTGNRLEVRRSQIARLVFRQREAELPGLSMGHWIRLPNGDTFSGQIMTDPLSFTITNTPVQFNLNDIQSLVGVKGTASEISIRLRTGSRLQGLWMDEDLAFKLDIGPQLDLSLNRFVQIADRLEGLAEVPAGPQTLAGAVSVGGISNRPISTNLAGLVWIPSGEFTYGSPNDEVGRNQDEGPQTQVVIPQGFWMGKCEVTQAEYQALMGTNPSNTTEDPQKPVERVNWHEAMEYCQRLTQQAQTNGSLPEGFLFRLPTEAEWEYACRAGTLTRFSYGDDKGYTQLVDYAWFTANSDSTTHTVGTKQPNPWGLFDMHGNVWEWCLDRWESSLPGGRITNNAVAGEGSLRGARSGSWLYDGRACRSANRDDYSPSNRCSDLGFRVVLAPIPR